MKVGYSSKSKDPIYYVQQGIRYGKKTTTKNLYKIGRHSELLKITDDPLEYAKQFVKKYEASFEKEDVSINQNFNVNAKLPRTGNVTSKFEGLNIGYLFLQKIYKDLDIKSFFKQALKDSKVKFDCDEINRFLTFDRILDPRSKLGTFNNLHNYFERPDISYESIFRHHDILEKNYSKYLEHLYKNSSNVLKRKKNICYYDCSNFYFETEENDVDYVDEMTGEVIEGLRKYGLSKDHKPSPIVEMGLFVDDDGIPITMAIHSDNKSEQLTAIPLEKDIVKMYQGSKFIYCADAGIGSYNIRKFNSMGGRAFVIAQSIKKLSAPLKEAVFNDFDYKKISDNSRCTIKEAKSFSIDILKDADNETKNSDEYKTTLKKYDDLVYKVIEASQSVELGLTEEKLLNNGKVKMVKSKAMLPQKIIITFSRKHMEYQRRIRNNQIERAKNIIDSGNAAKSKKGNNDVRRFIKTVGKNGAKLDYLIDEDVIREEEKYDGFYALATNLEGSAKEILQINKQRYQIEDCFRMLKNNLKARPVFHRKDKRIIAHFQVCYTALLIIRLLSKKLDNYGTHFTFNQIQETLNNMMVKSIKDIYYDPLYTSSDCLDSLNAISGLDLDRSLFKNTDLNKKII